MRQPLTNCLSLVLCLTVLLAGSAACRGWEVFVADQVLINDIEVVPPVVAAQPAVAAAQQQAQLDQWRNQYEPVLKVELSFAVRTAEPTDDEREALIAAAAKWFDQFIADFPNKVRQAENQRVFVVGGRARLRQSAPDPRELIAAGVAEVASATLPPDKLARYAEECRRREEFIKRTAGENIVARVDEQLLLAPDQRQRITESVAQKIDKNWVPQLEVFMMKTNFWPSVPNEWIQAELTPAQKTVWTRVARNSQNVVVNGGMAFGMTQQVIDDIELPEKRDPPAAEQKQ